MKSKLTNERVNFYRKNDYIVIEGFLVIDELEIWHKAFAEVVEKRDSPCSKGYDF